MADQFYIDIRDGVAEELLTEFGRTYTLQEEGSDAVFDEASGFFTTPGTAVAHTVTGIFSQYAQREIDGSSIQATDFKVILMAADMTVVPDTSMKILDGAAEYAIVHVTPLKPGGVDIIYTLQVR
jgi:hypothetical protein